MKKMGKSIKKSPPKRKLLRNRDVSTQTDAEHNDIDLITGDEPPRKYFKMLAEEKQKIVEQLVAENERLNDRIDLLEKENVELESMLVDARKLADFISSLSDDQDESGIVNDDHEAENEISQH